ncbi:MAG: hypothetical protein NDJ24_01235 [Alphaproteobacteria bacterium]|nr:hypothetical protein [Alphaproteobacteria bacterium]
MVYVVAIVGFIAGFALALQIVGYLLRDRPRDELLTNRGLRMTYGLLAWAIAALTSYCAIAVFRFYFPEAS